MTMLFMVLVGFGIMDSGLSPFFIDVSALTGSNR